MVLCVLEGVRVGVLEEVTPGDVEDLDGQPVTLVGALALRGIAVTLVLSRHGHGVRAAATDL